jgi:hypothetical protein
VRKHLPALGRVELRGEPLGLVRKTTIDLIQFMVEIVRHGSSSAGTGALD